MISASPLFVHPAPAFVNTSIAPPTGCVVHGINYDRGLDVEIVAESTSRRDSLLNGLPIGKGVGGDSVSNASAHQTNHVLRTGMGSALPRQSYNQHQNRGGDRKLDIVPCDP